MEQMNIFEILNNNKKHIIKNLGFDKNLKKYIYKNEKPQFECKYCGYNPRNWIDRSLKKVEYFLLVDKSWKVEQTFCEVCVSEWADYYKRMNLKEPKSTQLSLIQWNKYTRKTLKLQWLKHNINRAYNMSGYKPYFIKNGLRYYNEYELCLKKGENNGNK